MESALISSVVDVSPVRTVPSFFHEYDMPVSGVTVQVKVTATPNEVDEPPLEEMVGVGGAAGKRETSRVL